MARRASAFEDFRAANLPPEHRPVFVAGAYEFQPSRVKTPKPAGLARALASAYALLDYDIGYLSSAERSWLEASGARVPAGWHPAGSAAHTAIIARGKVRLGFILFPELKQDAELPDQAQVRQVLEADRKLRSAVDMLVGLSPWGDAGELLLLGNPACRLDILLGGGHRVTPGLRRASAGRILWVHPELNGRSIQQLEILQKPGSGSDWRWQSGISYRHRIMELGDEIAADPRIAALFTGLEEKFEDEP